MSQNGRQEQRSQSHSKKKELTNVEQISHPDIIPINTEANDDVANPQQVRNVQKKKAASSSRRKGKRHSIDDVRQTSGLVSEPEMVSLRKANQNSDQPISPSDEMHPYNGESLRHQSPPPFHGATGSHKEKKIQKHQRNYQTSKEELSESHHSRQESNNESRDLSFSTSIYGRYVTPYRAEIKKRPNTTKSIEDSEDDLSQNEDGSPLFSPLSSPIVTAKQSTRRNDYIEEYVLCEPENE
ncbi:hypothetical protein RFI_20757 [Reticulomyxa filosa]|uniref:Uncharacterized protein n=1 Tax=Reticulomyxa filosa TaxID=46433 RepID=X6MSC3_RETFI|nr:hypothetical protein RFI_20757 [Reticulomyxa filosa]|eukprot:ETO16581.1 hypothetical protein RFI_20757 [Reticulomyxa filosa]